MIRPRNVIAVEYIYQIHVECFIHTQNSVRDILLNVIQINEDIFLNHFEIHTNKSTKKSFIDVELRSYDVQNTSLDRIIRIMTEENGVLLATWASKNPASNEGAT